MAEQRNPSTRSDRGFTLVELVVVIGIIALIATSVSAGIMVFLKANVAVGARVDENRDLIALATWLPQDVNSTPATIGAGTGIETGNLPSGCATADPGVGLLRLTWTERQGLGATTSYRVSYRVVTTAGFTTIKRVYCQDLGASTVLNVSKPLATFPNGTIPVTVTTTATKVSFSVVQYAGTAKQRSIQIQADSRNPATAALPPPPPPPPSAAMTLSTGGVNAGSSMTASVTNFSASEVVTISLDYTSSSDPSLGPLAVATVNAAGAVSSISLTIPLSVTNGVHTVFAVGDGGGFAFQYLTVSNGTISLTSSEVYAGLTIGVDVVNFDSRDLITFLLDGNTVLGTVTIPMNANNTPTSYLTIPLQTSGGLHVITAFGTSGRRAISSGLNVRAAFNASPSTVLESLSTSAVLYGFRASEAITYTLDSAGGTLLGTAAADFNGYNTRTLVIPAFTSVGNHTIIATGDDGSAGTATVSVTSSLREYVVTPTTPIVTAGQNATFQLQATLNGVNDSTINGLVPLTVTGVGNSPNGTAPTAMPSSATFTNGSATISVNMVNAVPTTVTATSIVGGFTTSGRSTAVTVKASVTDRIQFAVACPSPIRNNWNSGFEAIDVYGNLVSNETVTMTFSPTVGNSSSIVSFTSGWITVTTNASYRSTTDASGSTPSFTARGNNRTKPATTVTATTSNAKSVSCQVAS